MKVNHLSLANFRGFEQIELKFEPDLNVIAGVNGVGKSAILDALAALLSRVLPKFTESSARPISFSDGDIRHGRYALDASAIFTVEDQRCHVGIQRIKEDAERINRLLKHMEKIRAELERAAGDKKRTKELMLEEKTVRNLLDEKGETSSLVLEKIRTRYVRTGELTAPSAETRNVLRRLRRRANHPIAIFFSSLRFLPKEVRTIPKSDPFDISNAYQAALEVREVALRDFVHWYRSIEKTYKSRSSRPRMVIKQLQEAVTQFVPGIRNLRVEEVHSIQLIVEKNGMPLVLNQLSDGEKGLLAILFDITRRLAIANPKLSNPIAEGKAVVLIDEIELHLHPLWQRQVLRQMRETFKSCQFIVTSHSPQVLGEVENRSIHFLGVDENGKVIQFVPQRSFGLDASRVLNELMGTPARNEQVERSLKKLFRLIDKEDFVGAKKLAVKIQSQLGEGDPELIRASSLISFLEGAK